MSRLLVQLLGEDERAFRSLIDRLEKASLNPSIDIRLSAEIVSKTHEKIRLLGLDAKDTTPKELFYALKAKLSIDDDKLKSSLKVDGKSADQFVKILAKTCTKLSKQERTLAMTTAGTKRVLVAVPPRKTLRLLKLRSIESVLKREDPKLVYAIASLIEDSSWRSQVHAKMKRLQSKDIEWQSVKVLPLNSAWLEKLSGKINVQDLQITSPEVGAVILLPVIDKYLEGITTYYLVSILQASRQLAIDSMPYRHLGFMQGYHNILLEIAHGKQSPLDSIHGLTPSWRAVHETLARGKISDATQEAELVLNDLDWLSTEKKLESLVPDMNFWEGSHYLALKSESTAVSLHILDVARAVVLKSEYNEHTSSHFEGSLWNELQIRYLSHEVIAKSLLEQLRAGQQDMVLLD